VDIPRAKSRFMSPEDEEAELSLLVMLGGGDELMKFLLLILLFLLLFLFAAVGVPAVGLLLFPKLFFLLLPFGIVVCGILYVVPVCSIFYAKKVETMTMAWLVQGYYYIFYYFAQAQTTPSSTKNDSSCSK